MSSLGTELAERLPPLIHCFHPSGAIRQCRSMLGKHSTCKGSLYTPKGGRLLPLHGSLCFYALRAFLPSVPGRARNADHRIKTPPGTRVSRIDRYPPLPFLQLPTRPWSMHTTLLRTYSGRCHLPPRPIAHTTMVVLMIVLIHVVSCCSMFVLLQTVVC